MKNYLLHTRLPVAGPWVALLALCCASVASAEVPRVLPQGKLPDDKRLGPLLDLDGYFPFHPCKTPQQWQMRSRRIRRQVLVATGLWPMPTKTPLGAVIHGKVDRDRYTVEKVFLESFPGHFVTGSLYRPKGRSGRMPAVLCPHGHWAEGRFHDARENAVKQEIARGAEKFQRGGRHPLQARCVQLARMGCVVFHYDMVGYANSKQLQHRLQPRDHMSGAASWGYFSPQAEARMQNMMGLQTYNSTRALDFLSGLPDVDPQRIAVTGASGGGTQTFILSAIDPRPAVAFPAVMVSTAMQGGCTCENACYLRVGTGNVEIAALFSPRPLGLSAANDWTKEMTTKGFPELKRHYEMLGVADRVMLHSRTEFGHNYNYPSRAAMYGWVNKHLKLGLTEPIIEEDYRPLSVDEMSVWDDKHRQPPGGDDHERALLKWITDDSQKQMAALTPRDEKGLAEYRRVVGGAVDVMIGRGLPEPGAIQLKGVSRDESGGYIMASCLVRYPDRQEELPIVAMANANWTAEVVIWIDPAGKRALFDDSGRPKPAVKKVLDAGKGVIAADLFAQGEFTPHGKPPAKARLDPKRPHYAGYTYGYNHPIFSQRVHDVLSLVALARDVGRAEKVYLVGLRGAGHWAAAACAQAGDAIDGAVIDTAGFRFAKLTAFDDPDFLPGGAKYGDLPGIIALAAPKRVWLAGEGAQPPPLVEAAYKAAGKPDNLTLFGGKEQDQQAAAVEWLLR